MLTINGNSIALRITWETMRRCKAAGFDLSQTETLLGDWWRGDPSLVEVGWIVCQCCQGAESITREQFEAEAVGEGAERLREELVRALTDFFPPPRAKLLAAAAEQVESEISTLMSSMNKPTDSPES